MRYGQEAEQSPIANTVGDVTECTICHETFHLDPPFPPTSWLKIIYEVLRYLHLHPSNSDPNNHREFFHYKFDMSQYIEKNWTEVCPRKSKTATWKNTISANITTHKHVFISHEDKNGYWRACPANELSRISVMDEQRRMLQNSASPPSTPGSAYPIYKSLTSPTDSSKGKGKSREISSSSSKAKSRRDSNTKRSTIANHSHIHPASRKRKASRHEDDSESEEESEFDSDGSESDSDKDSCKALAHRPYHSKAHRESQPLSGYTYGPFSVSENDRAAYRADSRQILKSSFDYETMDLPKIFPDDSYEDSRSQSLFPKLFEEIDYTSRSPIRDSHGSSPNNISTSPFSQDEDGEERAFHTQDYFVQTKGGASGKRMKVSLERSSSNSNSNSSSRAVEEKRMIPTPSWREIEDDDD